MLTDAQISRAKPAEKPYRLTDGGGLFLYITPVGGRHWRLRYEIAKKEKTLTIGPYPAVTLAQARAAREAAKAALREGKDPSLERRRDRLARTITRGLGGSSFEDVARQWHDINKAKWVDHHAYDVIHSLERDVFRDIGHLPIASISVTEVLAVLRKIEHRGAVETAHRVRQRMSGVFVFAIAAGLASADPAAVVAKALMPVKKGRYPAITDLDRAREMLMKIDSAPAFPVSKLAMRFLALTAVRPGTLVTTPWSEIALVDPLDPIWQIPSERMKMIAANKGDAARDHLVPLSRQALDVLRALRKITGRGPFLFPKATHAHQPASENMLVALLKRNGFEGEHVPHGWRSTFSTVMNERFPADRYVIDLMLAHISKDKVEAAYNRAAFLQRRRELAQEWADLITHGLEPPDALLSGPRRSRRLLLSEDC